MTDARAIITTIRDGGQPTADDLTWFATGLANGTDTDAQAGAFVLGRSTSRFLVSVYAMRMAAVFTLSVSTANLRTATMPRGSPTWGTSWA